MNKETQLSAFLALSILVIFQAARQTVTDLQAHYVGLIEIAIAVVVFLLGAVAYKILHH